MFKEMILSNEDLEDFDFEQTKENVIIYFKEIKNLEWDIAKLKEIKVLTTNYDFTSEHMPYISIGKDQFDLSAIEDKEKLLEIYKSCYCCAKSLLSDVERIYIEERFVNRKKECELIDLVGCNSVDSNEFRQLKRSAVYKFADFFGLVVVAEENEEKVLEKKLGGK